MEFELKREIVRISLLYPFLTRDQIRRKAKESLKKRGLTGTGLKKRENDNINNENAGRSVKLTQDEREIEKYDIYDIDTDTESSEPIQSFTAMKYKREANGSGSGSIQSSPERLSDVEQVKEPEMTEAMQKQTTKNASTLFEEMMIEEKENVKTAIKVSVVNSPIHSSIIVTPRMVENPVKRVEKQIGTEMNRSFGIQVDIESDEIAEVVWQFLEKPTTGVGSKSIGTQIDDDDPVMPKEKELLPLNESKQLAKKTIRQGTQTELVVVVNNRKPKQKQSKRQKTGAGILCDLFDSPPPKKPNRL